MTTATATILFTDLVGSTDLAVALGDGAYGSLRRRHDALLGRAVDANGGRVVKGLGDGIMATFPAAGDAVAAARAIQVTVRDQVDGGTARLSVRVGISAGDVTFEEGDCFGAPVTEAARICKSASGGQILASELVRLLARGRIGQGFQRLGSLELDGLGPVTVVAVTWEPDTPPVSGATRPAAQH